MSQIPPRFNKTSPEITTDDIYYDSQTNGWYITIWFYKGISDEGKLNSRKWYAIYLGWPSTTNKPELIKVWNKRIELLK